MTYAQLKTDVASWLNRSDLTALVPSFIRLAEARIARDVRLASMISTATLTIGIGASTVALPTDFAAGVNVAGLDGYTFVSPAKYAELAGAGQADRVYTIFGGFLRIPSAATSAVSLTLTYYAKPATFENDSDTNTILENHPGVYLYCAVAEAYIYVDEDARVALFEAKYKKEIDDIRSANWGDFFAAEQTAQSVA